jgi:hypothetical protein
MAGTVLIADLVHLARSDFCYVLIDQNRHSTS